jgi:hypothetical protein
VHLLQLFGRIAKSHAFEASRYSDRRDGPRSLNWNLLDIIRQANTVVLQKNMDIETETTVPTSKRQKFVELANRRVNNALKAISLIGMLSNRSAYEYSKDDAAKIFKALDEASASIRQRFETKKPEQGAGFHL